MKDLLGDAISAHPYFASMQSHNKLTSFARLVYSRLHATVPDSFSTCVSVMYVLFLN
jgi:hypothetical protein